MPGSVRSARPSSARDTVLILVATLTRPSTCDACTRRRRTRGNHRYRDQFGTYVLCARHDSLYT